ncbi:MAG: hypothetical protein K8L97_11970 [Anaerolineae bacterium]|nr:hypothetical protein [Anaerolineae bacterium]
MNTTLTVCKRLVVLAVLLGILLLALPVAADDREEAALAGIYLTENQQVKVTAAGFEIFSPTSCEDLLAVLGASEWNLVDQATFSFDPSQPGGIRWGILKRGDEALFISANGNPYCDAIVTPVSKQTVSASGVENIETKALLYTPFCSASASTFYEQELDEEFGAVSLFLIYDFGDGTTVFAGLDAPLEVGEFGLWELDEENVVRFTRSEDIFPYEFTQLPPEGEISEFYPDINNWDYESPLGTITVESLQPFRGSFELFTYVNDSGEAQTFSAGFECAHVAGADSTLDLGG